MDDKELFLTLQETLLKHQDDERQSRTEELLKDFDAIQTKDFETTKDKIEEIIIKARYMIELTQKQIQTQQSITEYFAMKNA